jgi:hypothetical protein
MSRGRSRRAVLTGVVAALVVVAAVVAAVLLWPDDDRDEHPAQERIRGVVLVHDEDGAIRGSWTACRPGGGARPAPGTKVEVVDGAGHPLGDAELRNVGPGDMDRLAALIRQYAVEDVRTLSGTGPAMQSFLAKGEGAFCLLQYAVRVDRASEYTLRFAGEDYDTYTHKQLEAAGWFYGFAIGF